MRGGIVGEFQFLLYPCVNHQCQKNHSHKTEKLKFPFLKNNYVYDKWLKLN
jgi:hypothetical protein